MTWLEKLRRLIAGELQHDDAVELLREFGDDLFHALIDDERIERVLLELAELIDEAADERKGDEL